MLEIKNLTVNYGLAWQYESGVYPSDMPLPGLLAPVTVLTDPQDIPHIRCQTKIDCLAVQGYIHARDRFFMMDFLRHVARAHLAEMIGVDGLDQDIQIRTLFVTRDGQRITLRVTERELPAVISRLLGTVKAGEDGELVLHVPSEHVTAVCSQILAQGAVDDITIQDVPLEDIISELFSRGIKV